MIFEESALIRKIGYILGYLFAYFLFTTVLFFILQLLEKLPDTWNYLHIMGITIIISIIGAIIKNLLR